MNEFDGSLEVLVESLVEGLLMGFRHHKSTVLLVAGRVSWPPRPGPRRFARLLFGDVTSYERFDVHARHSHQVDHYQIGPTGRTFVVQGATLDPCVEFWFGYELGGIRFAGRVETASVRTLHYAREAGVWYDGEEPVNILDPFGDFA